LLSLISSRSLALSDRVSILGAQPAQNANNEAEAEAEVDPAAAAERARLRALSALPFWARAERGPLLSQIAAFAVPLILSLNPQWTLPDLSVRTAPPPQPAQEAH
jgi:hypothetical protein